MSESNNNSNNYRYGNYPDDIEEYRGDGDNGWEEYDTGAYGAQEYSGNYEESREIEARPRNSPQMTGHGASLGKHYYVASDEDLNDMEMEESEYEERDYRPVRFRRDGKTGCLGGLMFAIFVIGISVILTCIGWMAASDVLALNKAEKTATITIEKNFDIEDVITQLKDTGIIEYKLLFRLFSRISDAEEKIDPGTYELSTIYDYRALVKKMQTGSGAQQTTKITFPEGYTQKQIFELLESKDICSADDLQLTASTYDYSYEFLEDRPLGEEKRLEGYLFPDTYEFYQGEEASTTLARFLRNFRDRFTAEMLEQVEASGYSLHQIVIIASLIESESANDEEDRANIASVIYNRLNAEMALGIDATIQYFLPERKSSLSYEDTQIDDPYNTYIYAGLPPGPISNPGIDSIMAALNPASTNYYYYALDTATGLHKFSLNLDEHNAFVATQNYG